MVETLACTTMLLKYQRATKIHRASLSPSHSKRIILEREIMEHGLIAWLVIGAIAGWLAGVLMKGGGFGLVVDIIVGIVGAFIGGWLAGLVGISTSGGWIASIITALVGAVVLLFVIRLFKRA